MPRILPALGAVAIIAFSIGFNIVQYPVVWDMVAQSGQLPEPAAVTQEKAASQSTKPAESVASIPSDKPAPTETSANSSTKPSGKENVEAETNLPETATYVKAEPPSANPTESSSPTSNLIAVPNNLFADTGLQQTPQQAEQYSVVQRLPPVDEIAPLPFGRYVSDYPQSSNPIYPSTGKE